VNSLLLPFYALYDLRFAYSHLRSDISRVALLKTVTGRLALPEDVGIMPIDDAFVEPLTLSYGALCAIVRSWDGCYC
jgi:hypothetical protein